jgi:hypothetical protein
LLMLEKGVGDGTEFVVDTLRYLEPVEGTEVRSDVVMLWYFANDAGEVVLDVLKAGNLTGRKVEIEGVTVVEFGVDERGGNGFDGVEVESRTDTPEIVDVPVAGFADRGDLVVEREVTIKENTEVASSVDWLDDSVLIDLE